jgi:hypothetical protein
MANKRIGGSLPFKGAGANYIETIDTDGKQLTAADSGKTFFCKQNSTADVTCNLPKLSDSIAGWNARFILASASSNNFKVMPFGGVAAGGTSTDDDKMYVSKGMGSLTGNVAHNLGSLADGAGESFDITVTGADLGDLAIASCLLDVQEMIVTANVRAANTVEVHVQNETTGTIDLANTSWKARVWPSNNVGTLSDNVKWDSSAQIMSVMDICTDGTYWWVLGLGVAGETLVGTDI